MNDMKQVTFFMEECRRIGLSVLGPDVNESNYFFTVNKDGAVRFGLGAIKGLGSSPVEAIISERKENGPFVSVFDFSKRVNPRNCNRTTFESLVYGGGFDSFKEMHRAQFFVADNKGKLFLDSIMRYGAEYQKNLNSPQIDIFSTDVERSNLPEPIIPKADEWGTVFRLNKEKEVIGIFISGHPLDDFKVEINSFCNGTVEMLNYLPQNRGRDLHIPAIITEAEHRFTKNGDPFGIITIEDYHDSHKLFLWRENYLKFRHFIQPGTFVAIKGKIEIPPRRSELEFVIHSIELLQNLKESKAKSIHLKVSSKAITHSLVMDINKLCQAHEGKCTLHFTVFDPLDDLEVRMSSKTIKINPTNAFFSELDKLEVAYEIR
jgi:DNA polymerase-3 subunit alpha